MHENGSASQKNEVCSEVARKGWWEWEWEDHLTQVLLTKPAEVVQEACQVLEKHGCPVKEELKSELYCKVGKFCQDLNLAILQVVGSSISCQFYRN